VIGDYHVHLRGADEGPDGPIEHTVEAVERYVEAAAAAGVDEVAFTEHGYYFRELEPHLEHPYQTAKVAHDLDGYCDAVVEAKRRGFPVKLGLEVDWRAGREAEVAEALAHYPWDLLLGSVHLVDGEMVDFEDGLWTRLRVDEVWHRYFAELGALASSGLVDVLAHPDLVKIFGRRPEAAETAVRHDEAVRVIADAGVAVEVSTAGLRRPVRELYPAQPLLDGLAAEGVPVTVASDAHVARDVGRDFDHALAALLQAGYETLTVFDARAPRQESLG
jgi:histidinol-phosphatase (PHP family)